MNERDYTVDPSCWMCDSANYVDYYGCERLPRRPVDPWPSQPHPLETWARTLDEIRALPEAKA